MESIVIQKEAARLNALPAAQARQQLGDRIARTFLRQGNVSELAQYSRELDFNAHLCTELRTQAAARGMKTIWDAA